MDKLSKMRSSDLKKLRNPQGLIRLAKEQLEKKRSPIARRCNEVASELRGLLFEAKQSSGPGDIQHLLTGFLIEFARSELRTEYDRIEAFTITSRRDQTLLQRRLLEDQLNNTDSALKELEKALDEIRKDTE